MTALHEGAVSTGEPLRARALLPRRYCRRCPLLPHLALHPPETGIGKVAVWGLEGPLASLDPSTSQVRGLEIVTLHIQASVSLSVKTES